MAKRPLLSDLALHGPATEPGPETVNQSVTPPLTPTPSKQPIANRGVHISIRTNPSVKDRIDELLYHRRHERPKVTVTSLILEGLNLVSEKHGLSAIKND